jgi:hypothetical protein
VGTCLIAQSPPLSKALGSHCQSFSSDPSPGLILCLPSRCLFIWHRSGWHSPQCCCSVFAFSLQSDLWWVSHSQIQGQFVLWQFVLCSLQLTGKVSENLKVTGWNMSKEVDRWPLTSLQERGVCWGKKFKGSLSKSQTELNHRPHFPTTDVFLFVVSFQVGQDLPDWGLKEIQRKQMWIWHVFITINLAPYPQPNFTSIFPLLWQRWPPAPERFLFLFHKVELSLGSGCHISDHLSQHPLLLLWVVWLLHTSKEKWCVSLLAKSGLLHPLFACPGWRKSACTLTQYMEGCLVTRITHTDGLMSKK